MKCAKIEYYLQIGAGKVSTTAKVMLFLTICMVIASGKLRYTTNIICLYLYILYKDLYKLQISGLSWTVMSATVGWYVQYEQHVYICMY